jgi:hypothetical protein
VLKRLNSLLAWSKTHEGKKLVRYTLSSVYTGVIAQTLILVTYGLRIIPGVLGATLFSNIVTIIPGYHLNRRWAWNKTGVSHWRKEVIPYWTMALAGVAFSMLGAYGTKHLIHQHSWSHLINTGLVVTVNVVCFAVFWVLKMLVFNKIFHTNKLRDVDEHLTLEEQGSH